MPASRSWILVVLCTLFYSAAVLRAETDRERAERVAVAEELYAAMTVSADLEAAFAKLGKQVTEKYSGISVDLRTRIEAMIEEEVRATVSEYRGLFVDAYASEFSAPELREMLRYVQFARTPLGMRFKVFNGTFNEKGKVYSGEITQKMGQRLKQRAKVLVEELQKKE